MPATALARTAPAAVPAAGAPITDPSDPRHNVALAYSMAASDALELRWLTFGLQQSAEDESLEAARSRRVIIERVAAIKGWHLDLPPLAPDCWPLDWQDDYGIQADYDDERQFGWAVS